jgi:hypothetical protein
MDPFEQGYISGEQMTSLILTFIVGMTILMLQFERERHQSRDGGMVPGRRNGRPVAQNRELKGFDWHLLHRKIHGTKGLIRRSGAEQDAADQ